MKVLTTFSAVVTGLLLVSGSALAGEGEKTFHELDKNQDGMVTQQEASADTGVASEFATADANQDGYLSKSEFDSISAMGWEDETEEAE